MAKTKNKKRNLSEKVHNKSSKIIKKSTNRFEVHINREKMKVLGRKLKNDKGLPGVSREKALNKRKHTLLQEYKVLNKANKFSDKRIGEKNSLLSEEDRVMARFTAERLKVHKKKSIFNLADEEVLTHKGQTLSEIEKFDDVHSDEDSLDEDDAGKLGSNFVEEAHFGGGILKKTGKEGAMTHRELIDQLIAESKKRKAEKQKIKEATMELTEKLDTEWKDLLPLVNKTKRTDDEAVDKTKADEYDKVMRELRFEARGVPSDRLKTEDELAKEEKERLEKLEQERLERMRGILGGEIKKPVHRSADDLDDDIVYESDSEYTLSYNHEGEANLEVNTEINEKLLQEPDSDSEQESAEEGQDEEEESEAESQDSLSDLKKEQSDSDEESEEESIPVDSETTKVDKTEKSTTATTTVDTEKIKADLLERKVIMEKARNELPYTFSIPESYEDFQKTMSEQSPLHQSIIIERMIKCNHPSLGKNNKENLEMLFVYLMQHLTDIAGEAVDNTAIETCFEIFKNLLPQIFDLAQLNPENALKSMIEIVKEKHVEFRKKKKLHPGLDLLLFLKLIGCLFPTSDFRHQIVSPCFIFMEQILTKSRVLCRQDIGYGLFITTLILEWTVLSKRFLPASINFLAGILHLAIPKSSVKLIKVLPPFKPTLSLLCLTTKLEETDLKVHITDLLNHPIDDSFKIRSIFTTLCLLKSFHENLSELPSLVEIFEPVLKYISLIPKENYPEIVQKEFQDFTRILQDSITNRKLNYIIMEKKRPKALKLYEPRIEPVYDVKKHKVQSKAKTERDKLLYKIKKERKGALREIRRDQAFLGRVKINERIQSDMERKEKVKRIYSEAAIQQSELNALDRKKKKK